MSGGTKTPEAAEILLDAKLLDIPRRLRFLEDLQQRPAFDGVAVLAAIVADYRRTLRALLRADIESETPLRANPT